MHIWIRNVAVIASLVMTSGCAVRSISDSGYRNNHWGGSPSSLYRGELHELDVVGQTALGPDAVLRANGGGVTLRKGQPLLVVQSGALMPDQGMIDALGEHFAVGTLSGIPRDAVLGVADYRSLAARGGYEAIVCYWGVLESARTDNAGKVASWVPIAGFFVHDEEQRVRIRLKILVVDVASGNWSMLMPEAFDDSRTSAFVSREKSDQEQVFALKASGYSAAAEALVRDLVR